jgi:hypothetical protein
MQGRHGKSEGARGAKTVLQKLIVEHSSIATPKRKVSTDNNLE